MATRSQLARVLDSCLDRIQSGDLTVEDCLREHTELAAELGPPLRAAVTAQQLTPLGPSSQFRSQTRARLLNVARSRRRVAEVPTARPRRLRWRPAYALAGLLVALALLGGSVGVAYASSEALPGDSLYGIKRGMERLALAITLGEAADARLQLRYAERRVAEVRGLLEAGRVADLETAVSGYQAAVDGTLPVGEVGSDHLTKLEEALKQHELALTAALEHAPAQAVPALEAALNQSQHGRQTVEQIRAGADPRDLAPGQLKKSTGEDQPEDLPPGQLKKQGARVPPGQLKKQNGELEDLPPGQLKKNACATDHPGRGQGKPGACADQ